MVNVLESIERIMTVKRMYLSCSSWDGWRGRSFWELQWEGGSEVKHLRFAIKLSSATAFFDDVQ